MMPFSAIFKNQHGAMFGMDARIALIVLSVLAAVGGISTMSKLKQNNVEAAEYNLALLHDAVLDYYKNIGIVEFPATLEDVFQEGLLEDPSVKKDPWGNDWQYTQISTNIKIDGVDVPIKQAVIFSAGYDGVLDSILINDQYDYTDWTAGNDDKGIKISSRDIELQRLEEYRARGQLIIDKITSFEAARYLEAMGACSGITPPTWCAEYEDKNYTQFNYYPRSTADSSEGVVYYSSTQDNEYIFTSGDINDMQLLMEAIGLPSNYATDPWGRVLFYHSNLNERSDPPFSASVCYSNAASCF